MTDNPAIGAATTASERRGSTPPPVDQSPIAVTVGRDVHHVARGSADGKYAPEIRPAKVTKVPADDTGSATEVSLVVWTDMGQFWPPAVPYHGGVADEEPPFSPYYRCPHTGLAYPGGTWHWPPRV